MTASLDALALLVTAAGLAAFLLAVLAPSRWRAGLGMTLDLWTAAGLLRLAGEPTWDRIAAAAALVAARRLIDVGLRSPAGRRGATDRH